MIFDDARDRLAEFGYAAGWSLVKSMPEQLSARWFRDAADVAAIRNGSGARQLRKNLRRVVGPSVSELRMDQLVSDALRSYSRYWLETFRLPRMDHDQVVAQVGANTEGVANLDEAVARGQGAIVALPHMGNWDVAALWTVAHGYRFTTVAERLKPESLYDRFVAYRESLGMEVLPLTGGPRPPSEVLAERLRAGGVVCLVADRDLSRSGVEVSLFGEAARLPGGPALLAATTGAALLPISLWFTPGGWGQRINAPITLPEGRLRDRVTGGTQALADVFAHDIAEHPVDWHMLHKLWTADLDPGRAPAAGYAATGRG